MTICEEGWPSLKALELTVSEWELGRALCRLHSLPGFLSWGKSK